MGIIKRLTAADANVVGLAGAIDICDHGSIALLGASSSKIDRVFLHGAAALFDIDASLGDLNCDGLSNVVELIILFSNWGHRKWLGIRSRELWKKKTWAWVTFVIHV